jgi:hypothetical protein
MPCLCARADATPLERIARLCQGWNEASEQDAPPGCGCAGRQDLQDLDESRGVARAGMVGKLGVSIAHEMNQPLAAILLPAAPPTPDLDWCRNRRTARRWHRVVPSPRPGLTP